MLVIYGSYASSAGRCFWLLEELGIPYEQKILNFTEKEHKSSEYLTLNPNGKVPTLVDDDFVLWESFAINNYLVEKYRPELFGFTLQERALVHQWTYWSQAHVQPYFTDILMTKRYGSSDEKIIADAETKVAPFLKIFDDYMNEKEYVVGGRFTLADINVGSVMNLGRSLEVDFDNYPNIERWLNKLKSRPAYQKFLQPQNK